MLKLLHKKLSNQVLSIIYRIEPDLLCSKNTVAWTNLGCWQKSTDYVDAATYLASRLAESVKLNSQDNLLEIGAGYGASLDLWHQDFAVEDISVLELQERCCHEILQKKHKFVKDVFQQSIFDNKPSDIPKLFDVILSVDATYHYDLNAYLNAIQPWLAPHGRVGFHLLVKTDQSLEMGNRDKSISRKLAYAKVDYQKLPTQDLLIQTLLKQGYQNVQIQDLTEQVLKGFSDYILYQQKNQWSWRQRYSIGALKIYLTAKLCRYLAETQQLQYVQVTAQKID